MSNYQITDRQYLYLLKLRRKLGRAAYLEAKQAIGATEPGLLTLDTDQASALIKELLAMGENATQIPQKPTSEGVNNG